MSMMSSIPGSTISRSSQGTPPGEGPPIWVTLLLIGLAVALLGWVAYLLVLSR